jgi:hypothetical protein
MYNVKAEYEKFASEHKDKIEIVRGVLYHHSTAWIGAIFKIRATGIEIYVCQSSDLADLLVERDKKWQN